jgi:hypothetical protein
MFGIEFQQLTEEIAELGAGRARLGDDPSHDDAVAYVGWAQ